MNFKQVLIGYDGEELKDEKTVITLALVCCNALMTDDNKDAKEKMLSFDLAIRIHKEEDLEVTPEEVVKMRELIHKRYGLGVMGPAYKLLGV